jgi:hypothetical protein
VGDGFRSDAGVAALASLSNLEILALKGGPALTDSALKPLATMPKLRSLHVYHSRITEQGLTHLYACQKLDSVEIKSSVPVSRQAVARLQTELPSLRSVDISQPEPARKPPSVRPARAALARR